MNWVYVGFRIVIVDKCAWNWTIIDDYKYVWKGLHFFTEIMFIYELFKHGSETEFFFLTDFEHPDAI